MNCPRCNTSLWIKPQSNSDTKLNQTIGYCEPCDIIVQFIDDLSYIYEKTDQGVGIGTIDATTWDKLLDDITQPYG